jgi:hypothetical protein
LPLSRLKELNNSLINFQDKATMVYYSQMVYS